MSNSRINIKEWFCPNQSVDKKNCNFLVIFEIFSDYFHFWLDYKAITYQIYL